MFEDQIKEHEDEIKRLKRLAADELELRRATVVPEWKYTILLSDSKWDRLYDDSVQRFTLEGMMVNREEWEAVGNASGHFGDGGHDLLFNTHSGKIICMTGGGTIHIGFGRDKKDTEHLIAIQELGLFLQSNPEGGDVTHIVNEYKATTVQ